MARRIPKKCIVCGKKIVPDPWRRYLAADEYINRPDLMCSSGDGDIPRYGYRGNNIVCTSFCGFQLAIKLVQAVPGILDLLPDDWRRDKV